MLNTITDFDFGDTPKAAPVAEDGETPFHCFRPHQLKELPMPSWLIPHLLFQHQVGLLYGRPGSFKTYVMIDLVCRLAHGMEWQGRLLAPATTLYICGEGFPMYYARLLAWHKYHGRSMDTDKLLVVDRAVNLLDQAHVNRFIRHIERNFGHFDLTVFDTFSTCTAGADESSSAVATAAIESGKEIGRELHSASMFVHHPGKDEGRGSRGHSALLGNIDAEMRLERSANDMHAKLTVSKQKDAMNGQSFHWDAHSVPLGLLDEFGDERSSLVLVPGIPPVTRMPGIAVPTEVADRASIAQVMRFDEKVSMSKLAGRLGQLLGKRSTAIERIGFAVPTTWIETDRGGKRVELRKILADKRGQSNQIEMRLLEDEKPSEEV
jgi:hypothetical protein